MLGLEVPAIGYVTPRDRLTKPKSEDNDGRLNDHGEFGVTVSHILHRMFVDLMVEHCQSMAALSICVLRTDWPLSTPELKRFPDAVGWNQWAGCST
jgi:hypothetical protein